MADDVYKFVDFFQYCHNCKFAHLNEDEDPCDCCIANPVNLNSHKPVNFEEKTK